MLTWLAVRSPVNRTAIASAGGIGALVALLSSDAPIAGNAANALTNVLSEHDPNRVAAREAGAVPLLVAMLRGGGVAASKAAGGLSS